LFNHDVSAREVDTWTEDDVEDDEDDEAANDGEDVQEADEDDDQETGPVEISVERADEVVGQPDQQAGSEQRPGMRALRRFGGGRR
jgi:hypothetical protein